jgi:hypothetical protein
MAQAFLIRRARVSARLAVAIQWIQSLRALGVMSDHNARAFGTAERAFRRSAGTLASSSSPAGAISSVTRSPATAPAASRIFRLTLSQWLLWPSGSSVARNVKPLRVPSTEVMPREGSLALAFFGRVRKVQEATFAVAAGRKSFALKRILEAVLIIYVCGYERSRSAWAGGRGKIEERRRTRVIPHATRSPRSSNAPRSTLLSCLTLHDMPH